MTPSFSSIVRPFALLMGLTTSLSMQAKDSRTIMVTGEGEASTAPDQVELTVGIDVTESKVEVSKNKSDEAMRRILAVTKEFKIESRDVQSDYIRMQPITEDNYPRAANTASKVTMYNTRRDVRILLRDISKYEGLLAGIFNSGANNLHSVHFRSSTAGKLEADARVSALKIAKSKAEAIAEQMNLKLGRPLSISEGYREPGPTPMITLSMKEGFSRDSSGPTLAPGEIKFHQTMTVVFEAE